VSNTSRYDETDDWQLQTGNFRRITIMRVLFVSAEMKPFAKTGGLGDVVSELPRALRAQDVDARVIIPLYGPIKGQFGDQLQYLFNFQFSRRNGTADVFVHYTESDGVPVYFLESWPFFGSGDYIYTDVNWDRERFVFFGQAAMALAWELGQGRHADQKWFPDVIHAHDWHTGLIPFLVHEARYTPEWENVASVLTVHNMAGTRAVTCGMRACRAATIRTSFSRTKPAICSASASPTPTR
jgi:starch synthase